MQQSAWAAATAEHPTEPPSSAARPSEVDDDEKMHAEVHMALETLLERIRVVLEWLTCADWQEEARSAFGRSFGSHGVEPGAAPAARAPLAEVS
jgi:hypothetical protein